MSNTNRLSTLFDNMDTWRHLPAYQLERRADIFFSIYLSDLLFSKFGMQIAGVIPEFPIHIGTIHPKSVTNRSFKVDYLIKVKDANIVALVELKTDDNSRRDKQDWYLESAKQVGLARLLQGVGEICKATESKGKYRYLLNQLQDMGLIALQADGTFRTIQVAYDIEIIYIQPNNCKAQDNVISFQEAATIIQQSGDELSLRFAKSLLRWASAKAGEE